MIAPKVVRHVVDRNGQIVSNAIEGRNAAYRCRDELNAVDPDAAPHAVATYYLREGAGKGKTGAVIDQLKSQKVRALIILPPKGRKP